MNNKRNLILQAVCNLNIMQMPGSEAEITQYYNTLMDLVSIEKNFECRIIKNSDDIDLHTTTTTTTSLKFYSSSEFVRFYSLNSGHTYHESNHVGWIQQISPLH